jgi:hypothetical protein
MTRQEQIEYIHNLYLEMSFVEMILCIYEYGYIKFFKDFSGFLDNNYRPTISDMYWNDVFEIFTNEFYSQLWRGLEYLPYNQFDEKRYHKNRYKAFDDIRDGTPQKSISISDLLD